ncbi:unnamed protein product [Polarella glacialis]|nr:unnamed protein product [Polarella glacialis]
MVRGRSPLVALLAAAAAAALVCLLLVPTSQPSAFLQPPASEDAMLRIAVPAALAATALPLPAIAEEFVSSSVNLATNLPPFEDPALIWVWQLSCFSMSLALVVWGRNGF